MNFNSVTYLLFLSLCVGLFWLLPNRPRLWMLLLSSILFYAFWRPEFALLMLFSACVDYGVSRRLEHEQRMAMRRWLLMASLGVNLGLLGFFKYLMFITDSLQASLSVLGIQLAIPHLNIILPLGISFYTFQTISYTVDVYRRTIPAEHDFVKYLCFVTFFPQLVAGPILRARQLMGQLGQRPQFSLAHWMRGMRYIIFGLCLKVLLADNVAPYVDAGFAQSADTLSALDVLTLAFLFGFQIYFDFAAYSQIALGSAALMGIHFPANFNFPYSSTSPREFWNRWHISLSSWIRDYLYLPLLGVHARDNASGGLPTESIRQANTGGAARNATVALLLTWAIMGLWHGANWSFLLWGLYHAGVVIVYRTTEPLRVRLPRRLRQIGGWMCTLVVMMLAWILFRADSLSDALAMYAHLLHPRDYLWLGMRENAYLVAAVLTLGVMLAWQLHRTWPQMLARWRPVALISDTVFMGLALALLFVFLRPVEQFIYFQF